MIEMSIYIYMPTIHMCIYSYVQITHLQLAFFVFIVILKRNCEKFRNYNLFIFLITASPKTHDAAMAAGNAILHKSNSHSIRVITGNFYYLSGYSCNKIIFILVCPK
jgi:hypothetical protein